MCNEQGTRSPDVPIQRHLYKSEQNHSLARLLWKNQEKKKKPAELSAKIYSQRYKDNQTPGFLSFTPSRYINHFQLSEVFQPVFQPQLKSDKSKNIELLHSSTRTVCVRTSISIKGVAGCFSNKLADYFSSNVYKINP